MAKKEKRVTRDPKTGQFKSRTTRPKPKRDCWTGQFQSTDPFSAGIPKGFRRPISF